MKELEFINYITKKFRSKHPVIEGIGDDAAVVEYTRDKYLLFTCDMIIEGTHFTKAAKPREIGYKAIAVNISDIAAMGGTPKFALVSAGIPRAKGTKFLKEITKGAEGICKAFGVSIIGGDTNASSRTALSVTLIGEVRKKYVARRSGAKVGDLLFVTGALGEGKSKHLNFVPRVKVAKALVENFKISSMMDISDGLAMDLGRIAAKSKVGACVYESLIPLSKKSEPLPGAIFSGEDFELLFTASVAESRKIIKRMLVNNALSVTLIGEITKRSSGVKLIKENGRAITLKPEGFRHL
ncbi:thiamine-monophosphate kinase [Candidatus Omnitrophota bacterium]